MATAEAVLTDEAPQRPRPLSVVLALLVHLGLLGICASAIYTIQPANFIHRRWAVLAVFAIGLLIAVVATRGRCGLSRGGKLATGLAAGLVLSLTYSPQLGDLPGIGPALPGWLSDLHESASVIAWALVVIAGVIYLATLRRRSQRARPVPFLPALITGAILLLVLGIGTYLALSHLYEIDSFYLMLIISNVVQFSLLLGIVMGMSGRTGVGSSMQIYLALALLAAMAHNLAVPPPN